MLQISASSFPPVPVTTPGELVAWIAADDARCHDEALRPLLAAALAATGALPLPGARTVLLVRQLVLRLGRHPEASEPMGDARHPGDVSSCSSWGELVADDLYLRTSR